VTNSRIGYRHPGGEGAANVVFADGHVLPIRGRVFPRALGGTNDPDKVENENVHGEPTVYANPERSVSP
jgi:prepilin-type processing-associated H-X9-DG protein